MLRYTYHIEENVKDEYSGINLIYLSRTIHILVFFGKDQKNNFCRPDSCSSFFLLFMIDQIKPIIIMFHFRFMDLEIWKEAISLNDELFDIAEQLESDRKFRMAEQLRSASLSISNNIAEGSGSYSSKDFSNFLNIARRSCFEVVNILIVISRKKYLSEDQLNLFLKTLDKLSRKISNFRKTLIKNT